MKSMVIPPGTVFTRTRALACRSPPLTRWPEDSGVLLVVLVGLLIRTPQEAGWVEEGPD